MGYRIFARRNEKRRAGLGLSAPLSLSKLVVDEATGDDYKRLGRAQQARRGEVRP